MISSDRIENVILRAEAMGLNLESYLMDNRLILMEYPKAIRDGHYSYGTVVQLLGEIDQYIRHYNCSRLVFDTLHPLLMAPSEPQIVNYIYSLMNSLEELNTTTIVVTGEPNSQKALRIIQLLEDAAIGSFVLNTTGFGDLQQRRFSVNKLLDRISPAMTFKVRIEHGTGVVQDLKPDIPETMRQATKKKLDSIAELPLHITIVDDDEDTAAQVEELFHPDSVITAFTTPDELEAQFANLESDLFMINVTMERLNWKKMILDIREYFPKTPIFLFTDKRESKFTGKTARLAGADGFFICPLNSSDVVRALEKAHIRFGTLEELIEKRGAMLKTAGLPEDFDSDDKAEDDVLSQLLSPSAFKAVLNRQIWRSKQNQSEFALVSFKMVYIAEMSKIPHLPQGLELVRTITKVVLASLRGMNDSTCRYMDKVVVLLEDTDPGGAKAFANRVIKDLKIELEDRLNIQMGKHLNVLVAFAGYTGEGDDPNLLWSQVTTDASRNFIKLHN